MRTRSGLLVALLPALFTAHRFANGFVFDDKFVIVRGTVIHDPARLGEALRSRTMFISAADPSGEGLVRSVDTYRPISVLTFFADAQLSGRAPWAYHLTNLALHCATTFLVFALARTLLRPDRKGFAAFAGAFFGLSPWLAEAHVWINGRSDVLCAFFALGALLAVAQGARSRGGPRIRLELAAAALFLAALLSKEVLLPALAMVPFFPVLGDDARWRDRARLGVPGAASAAAYVVVRVAVLGGMRAGRDTEMALDAARNLPILLADGLRALVIPGAPYLRSLVDEYERAGTGTVVASALGVAGIAAAAFVYRKRFPIFAFGAGSAALALAPVAVVTTVLWPGFGRYLYLPCALIAPGLAELLAAASSALPRLRSGLAAAAAAYAVAFGVGLAAYTLDFRDDLTLYGHAAERAPRPAYAVGFLGLSLSHESCATAVPSLRRATDLDPAEHRYLARLGRCLLEVGDREGARDVSALGLERFRGRPEVATYHMLAVSALDRRDPDAAVGHLTACLRAMPGRDDCRDALRFLLEAAPDREANRAAYERIRSGPDP